MATINGNLRINDKSSGILADDSTDASGHTNGHDPELLRLRLGLAAPERFGRRTGPAARHRSQRRHERGRAGRGGVTDTTVMVAISAKRGLQTSVQILATDPEGDPITCSAAFLQDGMTFDPATCTLSWTPSAQIGTKFHTVFRVATNTWPNGSGGSDGVVAEFTVTDPILAPGMAGGSSLEEGTDEGNDPTLTPGRFSIRTPFIPGTMAELTVFDLAGRRVAQIHGGPGSRVVWNGESSAGAPVPSGVYLYRLTVGHYLKTGRLVMVR